MQNFDYLSLDGRSLLMLKLIHEHGSVTTTARILGVTQSTVSHSLDRLRGLMADPLFLKVGRGMVPTERLEAMISDIEDILQKLELLHVQTAFEPLTAQTRFSIITNDFEHDLLVPAIHRHLREQAPRATLRTYLQSESRHDSLEKGLADIELRPYPTRDATDLVVAKLFEDRQVTYFDPSMRKAPRTIEEFAACNHAILSLGTDESTAVDLALRKQGLARNVSYVGPNFTAIATITRGTDMLATAPSRLASSIFRGFDWVETPVDLKALDFYMVWHVRNRYSPRHKWFRDLIRSVASTTIPTAS